jgi:hypothetical protein
MNSLATRLLEEETWHRSDIPVSDYLHPWSWEEPVELDDAAVIAEAERVSGEKYTGQYNWGLEGVSLRMTGRRVVKLWLGGKEKSWVMAAVWDAGGNLPGVVRVYYHGQFTLRQLLDGKPLWPITVMEELSDVGMWMNQDKLLDPQLLDRLNSMLGLSGRRELRGTNQTGVNSEGERVAFDFH